MPPRHSWEDEDDVEVPERAGEHSWESDEERSDAASFDSDSSSGEESYAPNPQQQLVEFCVGLYVHRKLSAKDLCTAMWWCSKCGLQETDRLAFRPDAPTGHYQRHLNAALPFLANERGRVYECAVPGRDKDTNELREHNLLMLPAHEVVNDAIGADDTTLDKLEDARREGSLPPAYFQHPVVRMAAHDDPVLPLSLFIDGVPYSNVDSIVGFWVVNEITQERHLVAAMRKFLTCGCGCRGWCTYYNIFMNIEWSFRALARRTYPSARHDGSPWNSSDSKRSRLENTAMKCKASILFIKGDWAEYASTFGFPTWRDNLRPCFCCNAAPADLYQIHGINLDATPWRPNTEQDYHDACARCEITVRIDERLHRVLVALLHYDRRKAGNRGRCLLANCPELGLEAGDRLTPSSSHPHPWKFQSISAFPTFVVFWRTSRESIARNRNPLFARDIGISPSTSLTLDVLHALYLGVMHAFARHVIWAMVSAGCWGLRSTVDETADVAVIAIKSALRSWYTARHTRYPP